MACPTQPMKRAGSDCKEDCGTDSVSRRTRHSPPTARSGCAFRPKSITALPTTKSWRAPFWPYARNRQEYDSGKLGNSCPKKHAFYLLGVVVLAGLSLAFFIRVSRSAEPVARPIRTWGRPAYEIGRSSGAAR